MTNPAASETRDCPPPPPAPGTSATTPKLMASPSSPDSSNHLAPAAATLARVSAIVVPKRTRVSRPKVRTGCWTCKKRHVKCDEKRPICLRCEQAGAECAGYKVGGGTSDTEERTVKKPASKGPRTKQSQLVGRTHQVRNAGSLTVGCSLFQPSPFCLELQGDEFVYFDLFRNRLAYDLSGFLPSNIWTRTVMAESMHNDCALHSIIALSALSRSMGEGVAAEQAQQVRQDRESALAVVERDQPPPNHHAQRAVYHYTKAMELFRRRISTGTEVPARDLLIATMLFVAYELMQGNILAADSLLGSGITLLKDSIRMLQPAGSQKKEATDDDMDEIGQMLARLLISNSFSPFSSPRGSINTLELTTTPYVDVPVVDQTSITDFFLLWTEFSTRAFIFIKHHMGLNLSNIPFDMEAAEREQIEYLRRLKLWETALRDFIRRGELFLAGKLTEAPPPGKQDFTPDVMRGLRIVETQVHMVLSFVSSCLDQTGLTFDAFLHEYRTIIDLSTPLIIESAPTKRTQFTFDIALTPMIGYIIIVCRDWALRMEAVRLYRKLTWREGAWNNRELEIGKMGLVQLEYSGADANGFVPPESRYYWTGSCWDADRKKMIATYNRLVPDADGRPVIKDMVLDVENYFPGP